MSPHPLLKIKDPLLGRLTLRAVVFSLFVTAIMAMIDQPLRGPAAPHGIVSFELAASATRAEQILAQWRDTGAIGFAKLSMAGDIVYPIAYGLAFCFLVCWVARRTGFVRWGARVAWWPVWAVICDYGENVFLVIQLVNERADEWASRPAAGFAMAKFAFLLLTILYLVGSGISHARTKRG